MSPICSATLRPASLTAIRSPSTSLCLDLSMQRVVRPMMALTGVLSSCETFARKSFKCSVASVSWTTSSLDLLSTCIHLSMMLLANFPMKNGKSHIYVVKKQFISEDIK